MEAFVNWSCWCFWRRFCCACLRCVWNTQEECRRDVDEAGRPLGCKCTANRTTSLTIDNVTQDDMWIPLYDWKVKGWSTKWAVVEASATMMTIGSQVPSRHSVSVTQSSRASHLHSKATNCEVPGRGLWRGGFHGRWNVRNHNSLFVLWHFYKRTRIWDLGCAECYAGFGIRWGSARWGYTGWVWSGQEGRWSNVWVTHCITFNGELF